MLHNQKVQAVLESQYFFPKFKRKVFAKKFLAPLAASTSTREENRDLIYALLDQALEVTRESEKPKLTFKQQIMVSKAKPIIDSKRKQKDISKNKKKIGKAAQSLGKAIQKNLLKDLEEISQPMMKQDNEKEEVIKIQNKPEKVKKQRKTKFEKKQKVKETLGKRKVRFNE